MFHVHKNISKHFFIEVKVLIVKKTLSNEYFYIRI